MRASGPSVLTPQDAVNQTPPQGASFLVLRHPRSRVSIVPERCVARCRQRRFLRRRGLRFMNGRRQARGRGWPPLCFQFGKSNMYIRFFDHDVEPRDVNRGSQALPEGKETRIFRQSQIERVSGQPDVDRVIHKPLNSPRPAVCHGYDESRSGLSDADAESLAAGNDIA